MASVEIQIAGRSYTVACRDGEEGHLREVAAVVDRKARDAASALGSLSETQQLLFASLMLADEIGEAQAGNVPPAPQADPELDERLERLAERIEALAQRLEAEDVRS